MKKAIMRNAKPAAEPRRNKRLYILKQFWKAVLVLWRLAKLSLANKELKASNGLGGQPGGSRPVRPMGKGYRPVSKRIIAGCFLPVVVRDVVFGNKHKL